MAYQYPQQPQGGGAGQGYQPQGYNPYSGPTYGAPPPNQGPPVYGMSDNAEAGVPKHEFGFTDQTVRVRFIRKVFTMVAIMLAVVTLMTAIPFLHQDTMQFIRTQPAGRMLYFVSYATFLVVYIALICCDGVRRSHPGNLILTGLLTLSIGYMTMMLASFHRLEVVLLTLIITTISCSGIILFSMQTKIDFTKAMGFVIVASLVLIVFGFIAIIAISFFKVKFLMTIYAGLAALLFMFYLAIDIQMLMGGRKYELSPEEHVFAAIQIFLDIVQIFWMLLMLFDHN